MKVAGYVRVSTQAQAQEGESLKTQEKQISDFIKWKGSEGWELIEIYSDKGRSGSMVEGRPAFNQMMQDAEENKFSVLVVHRLSRFARNARDLLNKVHELKKTNVKLVSIKENIDMTNPYGEFMLIMLAAVAQLEIDIMREQMYENKLAKWKKGEINIGQVPFGYKWDKDEEELIIVEDEKEIYLKMVDLYLNHGLSMKDIAVQLNAEGVRGKRKRSLSSTTVGGILKNPIYYGHRLQNRYQYEYDPKSGTHHRTQKLKPEKDHIFLKAPDVLDKLTWDKIQKKTAFNRRKSKRTSPETELCWLRDSLKCGICGGVVKPRSGNIRKDGTRPRYYVCYWRRASEKELKLAGKDRCLLPWVDAEKLERRVWMELVNFMQVALNPQCLKPLIDVDHYKNRLENIDKVYTQEKNKLKTKMMAEERILKDYEKDDDEFELVRPILRKRLQKTGEDIIGIHFKLDALNEKRSKLLIVKENDKKLQSFLLNEKKALRNLLQDIWKLPPVDRKTLVEASIEEPIKIEMDYLPPDEIITGKEWRFRWGENSRLNFKSLKGLVEKRILKQNSPK
jgi:site-specific DNA recombinase